MTVLLINPHLVVQRSDPFTTGIVYLPISLAYVAAYLKQVGCEVEVIDAYGENPEQAYQHGQFMIFGLNEEDILKRIPQQTGIIFVYANQLTNHIATIWIIQVVKKHYPYIPIVVLENTQAVTGYALRLVAQEFYQAGADYILTGEADERSYQVVCALAGQDTIPISLIDGLGSVEFYNPPRKKIEDLDRLPFPAWEFFPLQNYWHLRFAHGPQMTPRYLPLLTSRGCPYPCKFCVVPETNQQSWRSRSVKSVVDEMEYLSKKFCVFEFHIEDLDPTISDERTQALCQEMIHRQMKVIWKIVAGTKAETIRSDQTIDLMAQAGCRYISISPETGSPRVLKLMDKPFNLQHAVKLVNRMNRVGIRSQACFILGYPGEIKEDLEMTKNLVWQLTKEGVDEIALFIVTPVPGSAIFEQFHGYQSLSELNFTPTWRSDFQGLHRFRLKLYLNFLWWKFRYHPLKILIQPFNFLRRYFETKMEMVPYRAMKLMWWQWRNRKHKLTTQSVPFMPMGARL